MDEDTLSICTVQYWFNWFKSDNFELNDSWHSGRPLEMDVDVLKLLIEEDPRLTTRCLAERLGYIHAKMKTPERITQGVEIWNLDTTSVITASAPTTGRYLYSLNDVISQRSMVSQSHYWRWKVSAVCQSHEEASMAGNWTNRYSNTQRRSSSKKDHVKCLMGCKGNYILQTSSKCVQYHCWSLLLTIRLSCSKTPRKAG